jgi:hypothetical protein
MESHACLDQPITDLGFTEEFCASSKKMGFQTIKEIIVLSPENIISRKGFSYTWLGELSEFLDKRRLLHLLQPIPGKSYD